MKHLMKHLKLFESFKNIETIKKEIYYILQELTDIGFYHRLYLYDYDTLRWMQVFFPNNTSGLTDSYKELLGDVPKNVGTLSVTLQHGSKLSFKFTDIEDDIYHLLSYMESMGKNLKIVVFGEGILGQYGTKGSTRILVPPLDFNSLLGKFNKYQISYMHFVFEI